MFKFNQTSDESIILSQNRTVYFYRDNSSNLSNRSGKSTSTKLIITTKRIVITSNWFTDIFKTDISQNIGMHGFELEKSSITNHFIRDLFISQELVIETNKKIVFGIEISRFRFLEKKLLSGFDEFLLV